MNSTTYPKPTDRISATKWARALVQSQDVLFLDTETTGLGKSAEIVDLAIVTPDGRVLANQLVKPVKKIPIDAFLIHGIGNDQVADAPSWLEVLEMYRPLMNGKTIVAYNSSFDRSMIEQCTFACEVELPAISWECAMRAYASFRKDPTQRSGGYRWRPTP